MIKSTFKLQDGTVLLENDEATDHKGHAEVILNNKTYIITSVNQEKKTTGVSKTNISVYICKEK